MSVFCSAPRLLLPVAAPMRRFVGAEPDLWAGKCPSAAPRRNRDPAGRFHAAASAAVETEEEVGARPPCYKEVWVAPEPSRLINDKRVFLEEHRIRGYEAGPDQRTTVITMANLLQEVASNHAVAMWGRSPEGFATDPAMAKEGLIFVMTRMQIQMDRYPTWGEMVEFETWFQAAGKIGAQRDWVVRDKSTGEQLGRATSTWVMINMHTRRLSKMPDPIRRRCGWYQLQPPRDAIPPQYTRAKIPEVPLPPELNGPKQVARRSDMDMNGHINNVTYLAWALETVPADVHESCHLYQLEVDYKAECHSGEVVEVLACRADAQAELASNGAGEGALAFVHTLRRCEGEACMELVRARTTWRAGEAA